MTSNKRKLEDLTVGEQPPKHQKTTHSPNLKRKAEETQEERDQKRARLPGPLKAGSGKRLFLRANLFWEDQYGRKRGAEGVFMVDTGSDVPLMNENFLWKHKVPRIHRAKPITILAGDEHVMEGAGKTHTPPIIMRIKKHQEEIEWEVGKMDEHIDGYLPIEWLNRHNPDVDWANGRLRWRSEFCKGHCLPINMKTAVDQFVKLIKEAKVWKKAKGAAKLLQGAKGVAAQWHDATGGNIADLLPPQYRKWASVFSEEEINRLPDHGPYDHAINLVEGAKPPWGPIYPLSERELQVLREYIEKELKANKIRPSKSPAGAPVLFVPKSDGSLRLCVDYRALNKITVKDRYPLPLMTELRERLAKAKVFTKLDLKNGYNLIRIRAGDEWKTAFRTRYGLFEYMVMPFGLCNAPASFQAMINEVLRDLLDEGVIVYIDDILIYSETEEEHEKLVAKVLKRLSKHRLCAAIKKCQFHVREVEYLGYRITKDGISMSPKKVQTIRDWETPKSVKEVQEFMGFANFYRRFIHNYSAIAKPLTDLTKKDLGKFKWTEACEEAFTTLKDRFTSAPILAHFHAEKETIIETDASDFALAAILSQRQDDEKFHPIAFHSRKFTQAEINYDIHDKEMGAIVQAFKEWEHMLKSVQGEITVFTDHKNLEYFATTKKLTRRQARWSEHMAEFNYKVIYRPGAKNTKADILSRRSDYAPEGGSEIPERNFFKPGQLVLEGKRFAALRKVPAAQTMNGSFRQRLMEEAVNDPDYLKIRTQVLGKEEAVSPAYTVEDEMLFYKSRFVVPNSEELKKDILREEHDSRVAGHYGQHKTMERVTANFYWKNMDIWIEDYVRSCTECQRNKSSRHKRYGMLQPLEIPWRPWASISMDFIVSLPESEGYSTVCVVVDRLTKMAHFFPLKTKEDRPTEAFAKAFAKNVWSQHGLPADIVSDRDAKFTSRFWQELMDHLGVKLNMSTPFHPQTDGQTERVNQVLEAYLRHYCNFMQDDWADLLHMAEYAYNTATSESTKMSPFEANYGFQPETQWMRPKSGIEWANPAAEILLSRWQGIWKRLHENLAGA